jgi:hypothetical protein
MTTEQWLLYLYSIYPSGKAIGGAIFLLTAASFLFYTFSFTMADDDQELVKKSKAWGKRSFIAAIILVSVNIFLPSREMFIAIVATPKVLEIIKQSADEGKIRQLDEIVDKSLTVLTKKLDKELEEANENRKP